jgi:hypothetical protein
LTKCISECWSTIAIDLAQVGQGYLINVVRVDDINSQDGLPTVVKDDDNNSQVD